MTGDPTGSFTRQLMTETAPVDSLLGDLMAGIVLVCHYDGRMIYLNKYFRGLLRNPDPYSLEDLLREEEWESVKKIAKEDGGIVKLHIAPGEREPRRFRLERPNAEVIVLIEIAGDKDYLLHELTEYKEMVKEREEFLGKGSFEYNLVGGNHFISEGLLHVYGVDQSDPSSLSLEYLFSTFYEEDEQERIRDFFTEMLQHQEPDTLEVTANINGVRKFLEIYAKVYRNIEGVPVKIMGTTRDITQMRSLNNQLLSFRKELTERELLLKHGTWEYDLGTGQYSVSAGLYEVFGVPQDKNGFSMDDHFLPGSKEKRQQAMQEALEHGFSYADDLAIHTGTGEIRYVEMFSRIVTNANGGAGRLIGLTRDITRLQSFKRELKEQITKADSMNQELSEAKMKLESKLEELEQANTELRLYKQAMLDKDEFLNQGTWEWDIKANRFSYSRGIYRLFGYHHKDEMKAWDDSGKDIHIHMDEEERRRSAEDWKKILEEADTYLREMEIVTKDGYQRRLETFGKVFRDESGEAYKVIGTTRDITKLKEYEQELEVKIEELNRSNKDLEEFAYIASHDLHEPLRKLSTFGQRLSQNARHEMSPANVDYLERMLKATDTMRNLIDNLLEFSRVTRGAATFVKTDLNQLMDEVLSEQELRIEETGASVHVEQLPELEVVPSQIKQVFNNLLSNAIKFVKPGVMPRIDMGCRHVASEERTKLKLKVNREYYLISVQDNGIGFDKIYAEKIFQIFQRLHGKSEYAGSGIGLAICRKIADNHKGLIFAESEPGKGALFTLILPNKP